MTAFAWRAVVVFGSVTIGCITIGWLAITVGVPEGHDYLPPVAPASYADMYGLTAGWAVYSVLVFVAAVARARILGNREVRTPATLWRGSVWLWGAIGAPWLYWYAYIDLGLFGMDPPERAHGSGLPFALGIGLWWWLGALLSLVIAIVWSAVTAAVMAQATEATSARIRS